MQILETDLNEREVEIFDILCIDNDSLSLGESIPSLRKIQKRFSIGQVSASKILKALASRYGIVMKPRTKLRKQNSSSIKTTQKQEVVLLLCETCRKRWMPIIRRYNQLYDCRIMPHFVENLEECIQAIHRGNVDFVLFPSNPFAWGMMRDSLLLTELSPMISGLKHKDFYDASFMKDPTGRFWGIGVFLNTMVLSYNPIFCNLPEQINKWEELFPYFEEIKAKHPNLDYAAAIDGYVSFLIDSGVRMVCSETGKIQFNCEKFSPILNNLKEMVEKRYIPIFSDVYMGNYQSVALHESKVAINQSFHGKILQHQGSYPVIPSPGKPKNPHCVQFEIFSICADSMKYEQAWNFIEFALSEEVQYDIVSQIPSIPTRRKIIPPHLNEKQFKIFESMLNDANVLAEDYYFPYKARIRLACGIDRWIKYGGSINSMLSDLEKSCQQVVEFSNFKGVFSK